MRVLDRSQTGRASAPGSRALLAAPVAFLLAVAGLGTPSLIGKVTAGEPAPSAVVSVASGDGGSCALLADGSVACWGGGPLGIGTRYGSVIPQVADLEQPAIAIAMGEGHACALLEDATVSCWGRNFSSQIGAWETYGDFVLDPTVVSGVEHIVSVAGGSGHTCAVRDDGTAWCWGYNGSGQLGFPDVSPAPPTHVPGITDAVAVTAGEYHTCLLLEDGTVSCFGYWGPNEDGDIVQHSPTPIDGFTSVTALASGQRHTCGVIDDGTVRCFGQNGNGQLGNGSRAVSDSGVTVDGLANVVAIGAGPAHTCAAKAAGGLFCWGSSYGGQLGTSDNGDLLVPHKVDGIAGVTAVDGGQGFTCAVAAGTGMCWGRNGSGQLGDRTYVKRTSPGPISWVPDTDAPTVASPLIKIRSTDKALYGTFIRTRVGVPADDGVDGTGIQHIEAQFSKDGGTTWGPINWYFDDLWNKKVQASGTIVARGRAVDGAGNVSEWVTSDVWTPRFRQESDAAIDYDGAWHTQDSGAYSGEATAYTTSQSASATFTFTGRSIGILARESKARGEFRVFVDGENLGVVDLRSSTRHLFVVVFAQSWATSGEHTIRIVALGTEGRPRIDLDAFVVIG